MGVVGLTVLRDIPFAPVLRVLRSTTSTLLGSVEWADGDLEWAPSRQEAGRILALISNPL